MKWQITIAVNILLVSSVAIFLRAKPPATNDIISAEEMLGGCRAVANAPIVGDGIRIPNDGQQCWGAFTVIQDMTRWTDVSGSRMFSTCSPTTSTESEMVAVFVKYVDDHPNVRHQNFVDIALASLRTAFPCTPRQGLFK
jgi:hypothetical protein